MRWRVILWLSLIANLLLAVGWGWTMRREAVPPAHLSSASNAVNTTNVRTAVIVRRQFFTWQEVESRDYPTYIKNLRDIGCPEQTIRDIIIADVTEMLREKLQIQRPRIKPHAKWWTNRRDATEPPVDENSTTRMWAERAAILEQLLGAGWAIRGHTEAPATNSYVNLILATLELNPLLQGLPADKKQQVAALLNQSANESGQAGDPQTPYNVARVLAAEKARWAQLMEILTVDQLEAAKLHFSSHAENLRNELDELPGFDTRPEEFKKIYKSTEEIDVQISALAERDDPEAQQLRQKLLAERDAAVRAALAPARYEQYARLRDPAYLNALELLANSNGNPNSLATLYAINREAAAELERIETDPTLTETQRQIEFKRLELEQLKATAQALGEKLLDEPAPQQTQTQPKPEPKKVHSVAAGEGLERIARIYGVEPGALRAANPGVNFDTLKPGTAVNVPLRLIYPLPPPD
jgi:LysM repeat protein